MHTPAGPTIKTWGCHIPCDAAKPIVLVPMIEWLVYCEIANGERKESIAFVKLCNYKIKIKATNVVVSRLSGNYRAWLLQD